MKNLNEMTAAERSLLLYIESCATDLAGRMDQQRLNDGDRAILDRWGEEKFIQHGRIVIADHTRQGATWVRLSEEAILLAHAERRARMERMWKDRRYETTIEKAGGTIG